jgi:uncharacterized protein YjbJ (UPF0337 family)
MGERIDEAKGRTKEAAGDLTDDDKLKREGKVDRKSSSIKDKVGDAADKVGDTVDSAADKIKERIRGDRDPRN